MTVAAVTHRGTDIVAVSVVVGVVGVVVVVVVVNGSGTVRMRSVRMIPWVVGVVRSVPAPSVAPAIVVPVGIIPVGTVAVARPPPVVTQVDTDAPAGWTVVVPV